MMSRLFDCVCKFKRERYKLLLLSLLSSPSIYCFANIKLHNPYYSYHFDGPLANPQTRPITLTNALLTATRHLTLHPAPHARHNNLLTQPSTDVSQLYC